MLRIHNDGKNEDGESPCQISNIAVSTAGSHNLKSLELQGILELQELICAGFNHAIEAAGAEKTVVTTGAGENGKTTSWQHSSACKKHPDSRVGMEQAAQVESQQAQQHG